jgi:hypothetical protein
MLRTKPEPVTADTLRNILQAGQDRDNILVRAYEAVAEALKDQDMKPIGKRLLTQAQKTIPTACYRHAASMTYLDFTIGGQEVSIFLSYNARFEFVSLAQYNTPCTTGATERTAKRNEWLNHPQSLDRLAAMITAYNEARYAMQTWESEAGHTFPESLPLKGLHDRN